MTSHQLNVARLLLPICPPLAALHVTRARLLSLTESDPDSAHCQKCGSFLFNGNGEIRSRRKRTKRPHPPADSSSRVLQKTCQTCGFRQDVPLHRGNAALFPRRGSTKRPAVEDKIASAVKKDVPRSDVLLPAQSSATAGPERSGKRPKRRGLQDMLSRNREKAMGRLTEQSRQSEGGLAAFLGSLEGP
jgi:RNase P subunit RPR2